MYFNAAMIEVRNLNEIVAILALKWGLWNAHLIFFLDKNFSSNYTDLARARKYAQAEEVVAI